MNPMTARNDLALFFKDSENAQKLNGLLEDTRGALMDYQAYTPKGLPLAASNIYLRPLYNKISTKRAVK